MKDSFTNHQTDSMEMGNSNGVETNQPELSSRGCFQSITDDDRYPGSFFRVPGVPVPGKTSWSLTK